MFLLLNKLISPKLHILIKQISPKDILLIVIIGSRGIENNIENSKLVDNSPMCVIVKNLIIIGINKLNGYLIITMPRARAANLLCHFA
jgi:hypothetical protein